MSPASETYTTPEIELVMGTAMVPRLQKRAKTPGARRNNEALPSYMQPTFNTKPWNILGAKGNKNRFNNKKEFKKWRPPIRRVKSPSATMRHEFELTIASPTPVR